MINDSYWEEYNNGECASLFDADGQTIAYIQKTDSLWFCRIFPKLIAETFKYYDNETIEEVEWHITSYISSRCNKVANQLYRIRDHLPSIHELAERARYINVENERSE